MNAGDITTTLMLVVLAPLAVFAACKLVGWTPPRKHAPTDEEIEADIARGIDLATDWKTCPWGYASECTGMPATKEEVEFKTLHGMGRYVGLMFGTQWPCSKTCTVRKPPPPPSSVEKANWL